MHFLSKKYANTNIDDLPLQHGVLHGVGVEADHGEPHQGQSVIKKCGLYIHNAFLKDTMVIIATVSKITHTTDKKH